MLGGAALGATLGYAWGHGVGGWGYGGGWVRINF
jgi:hypothetical protein